ncbi:hypothetical protein Bca52824_076118 [Brassica carinata]|uniref:Uncharacterized protein n=1 Tax=Brassica carinata TaxID=52824 RepID=A0A8X7PWG2_BRACI|nr:hypothetical protein Bca52824_076118 [Brassica carinata]
MFHESFECDGELDSNDEQHDGDELTMPKLRWRRAETLEIDDWSIGEGETTNHGLQSRDAERLHGVEESSRCQGLPVSPPKEEKGKRRKTTLLLQPT